MGRGRKNTERNTKCKKEIQNRDSIIYLLSQGKLFLIPQTGNNILERSRSGWDSFGVRDPAILADENGYTSKVGNKLLLYYTGSRNGYDQCIGLSTSYDGITWKKVKNPVLSPSPDKWDSGIASTPWVVKCKDGLFRMYYRGGRGVYKGEGLGLAISQDGKNFEKMDSPLITVDDIKDISSCKTKFMGVMNFSKTLDGKNLVLFEAPSKSLEERSQIFAVYSDDYENFKPFNGGYPIFTRDHVKSWYVERVANPRLYTFEDEGLYMLVFNGAPSKTFYSIGIAFSRDLINWWEYRFNPILVPSEIPLGSPFSGRLEGGVFLKEGLERRSEKTDFDCMEGEREGESSNCLKMYFMAIPYDSFSHERGVIALISFKLLLCDDIIYGDIPHLSFSPCGSYDFESSMISFEKRNECFPRVIISSEYPGKLELNCGENDMVEISTFKSNDLSDVTNTFLISSGKVKKMRFKMEKSISYLSFFKSLLRKMPRGILDFLESLSLNFIYKIGFIFGERTCNIDTSQKLNLEQALKIYGKNKFVSIRVIRGKAKISFREDSEN